MIEESALIRSIIGHADDDIPRLVRLDLFGIKMGPGIARLAYRMVLPRCPHCRLGAGVPKSTATRLRCRPGVRV